jgi:uncharacterized membrane protein YedE/YeeE
VPLALGVAVPLVAVTALALALGNALSLPAASASAKGWIDVAFGVVLVGLGVRAATRPGTPTEARPRPEGGSLARYLAMGSGLMVSNVTTLALYIPAMKLISESTVSDTAKAGAVAIALVVTLSLALAPLAIVICFGLGSYLIVHGLARVL